jgi:Na+-transporting methylmalonyl-CoA/oxaloacetate decarboxylase gamma subunit
MKIFRLFLLFLALAILGVSRVASSDGGTPAGADPAAVEPEAGAAGSAIDEGHSADEDASAPLTAAAAARQKKMDELAASLREIADRHGPDAVVLQTKLLMHCLRAQALGPTEVRVAGADPDSNDKHLLIQIDTGIYFDRTSSSQLGREDALWDLVAGPALVEMNSFALDPEGLTLSLVARVQDASALAGGSLDATAASDRETVRFEISPALLRRFHEGELDAPALREALRGEKVGTGTTYP